MEPKDEQELVRIDVQLLASRLESNSRYQEFIESTPGELGVLLFCATTCRGSREAIRPGYVSSGSLAANQWAVNGGSDTTATDSTDERRPQTCREAKG